MTTEGEDAERLAISAPHGVQYLVDMHSGVLLAYATRHPNRGGHVLWYAMVLDDSDSGVYRSPGST